MLDIVENLGKRQLSVTSFASRYSVTTRYIQKLFEGEGTTFTDMSWNGDCLRPTAC